MWFDISSLMLKLFWIPNVIWTEEAEGFDKRVVVIFLARDLKNWILGDVMIWVLGLLGVFSCSQLLVAKKKAPVRRCDINLSLGDFTSFLMTRTSDVVRGYYLLLKDLSLSSCEVFA